MLHTHTPTPPPPPNHSVSCAFSVPQPLGNIYIELSWKVPLSKGGGSRVIKVEGGWKRGLGGGGGGGNSGDD